MHNVAERTLAVVAMRCVHPVALGDKSVVTREGQRPCESATATHGRIATCRGA